MVHENWERLILSNVNYENLVAELSFSGQFLLLLDCENGKDIVHVSFPKKNGELGLRIPLNEFLQKLHESAVDLCKWKKSN